MKHPLYIHIILELAQQLLIRLRGDPIAAMSFDRLPPTNNVKVGWRNASFMAGEGSGALRRSRASSVIGIVGFGTSVEICFIEKLG